MAETTALVPIPFFAPVRTGTGSLFDFKKPFVHPLRPDGQTRTAVSTPGNGTAYDQDGGIIGDPLIGSLIDIYA